MKAKYDLEELQKLVAVTLDGTGIDPKKKKIDWVIPDCILHQFNPNDVLKAAYTNGFIITRCEFGDKFQANGAWIKPDMRLGVELSRYKGCSDSVCPECAQKHYSEFL